MEQYMIWIWLAVFIISLVVEAATQDLVSIWFAIGSIVGIILSLLEVPYYIEIIVFAVVSLALLILTRPVVKKLLQGQIRMTNSDELIGKSYQLLTNVSKLEAGTIKINDVYYQAVLPEEDNEEIEAGTIVKVVAISGNKVVVRKKG